MNGHDPDLTYDFPGADRDPRSPLGGLAFRGRADFDRGKPRTRGGAEKGLGHPAPTKRRVLLATGDDRLRAVSHDYLRDQGYAVATATGGVECLTVLRGLVPDVVVLDTDLLWGGADGVLACLQVESRTRIPVVLLAPSADAPPRCGKAIDAPVAAVLKKPVVMASLLQAVQPAAGCTPSKGRNR
jgi:CheY-like chemotaxis protein